MMSRMWEYNLKAIFDLPASLVIIQGEWKKGKTDFSLFIIQELLRYKIIGLFGSNIWLETKDKRYSYITNIYKLKKWVLRNKIPKAFIYDEAMSSTPKRRAMSKLNVLWSGVIAELSKGLAKLIVVTQDPRWTESIFYNPVFLRGIFIKKALKYAELRSNLCSPNRIDLADIPKTRYKFDPYRTAPFSADPEIEVKEKDERFYILNEWIKNPNWSKVGKELGLYPQQVKRMIIKAIEELMIEKA